MKKILDGYENQRVNYRRQKGSKYHPARSCRDLQLDSNTAESGRFVMPLDLCYITARPDVQTNPSRKRSFSKRSLNRRNLKTQALPFNVVGKQFEI